MQSGKEARAVTVTVKEVAYRAYPKTRAVYASVFLVSKISPPNLDRTGDTQIANGFQLQSDALPTELSEVDTKY